MVRMTLEGTSLRSELTKEFALVLLASCSYGNASLPFFFVYAHFFSNLMLVLSVEIFLPTPLFKIFPNFDKFALLSHIWSF